LARVSLHRAFTETRDKYPFRQAAVVLLPDHLHCIWTLPENDADFSLRWKVLKHKFTRHFLRLGGTALPIRPTRNAASGSGGSGNTRSETKRNSKLSAITSISTPSNTATPIARTPGPFPPSLNLSKKAFTPPIGAAPAKPPSRFTSSLPSITPSPGKNKKGVFSKRKHPTRLSSIAETFQA